MVISDQFVIECSNGEIVIDENDLIRCDYFRHLVNGQKKLNLLNKKPPRNPKYTIKSGKLYPLKILEFYFELLMQRSRIQEVENSKSALDQKPTNLILQILGFLFSDGRGQIYNSQKDLIGSYFQFTVKHYSALTFGKLLIFEESTDSRPCFSEILNFILSSNPLRRLFTCYLQEKRKTQHRRLILEFISKNCLIDRYGSTVCSRLFIPVKTFAIVSQMITSEGTPC